MPSMASSRLATVIVDEPAQLLDRHVRRADREIGDRVARGGFLLDEGLEDAVGKLAADLVDRVLHLVDRLVDVGADLELDDRGR